MRWACAALLLACGTSSKGTVFDGGDYQVGAISLHVASGAAVTSQGLTLVLSDQPDTCAALQQIPVQRNTKLALKVVAAADGTASAVFVNKATPGPGEATGTLGQMTGEVQGTNYVADSGNVAWTVNANGSVTITLLDVGFAGVSGRIAPGQALTLPACTP